MKRAAALLAVAAIVIIGGCGSSRHATQFTLQMRPTRSLSAKDCITEARHYGYSSGAGAIICAPARRRSWYRAVLANRGAYGLPSCVATGFDAQMKKVFTGRLFFGIGGIRGMFVPAHRSITFYWYLPRKTRSPVARYTATCTPVANPPV
jgi:hypothetical protein